jgi:hypothetical protein
VALNDALRLASDEIFRDLEILTPSRVRIGASATECDPNTLLAFLQAEVYRRAYARFRDVPAELTTGRLLATLRSAPGGAHSFGTHRSLLVALALNDIYLSRLPGETNGWRALQSRFESAGLRLERPHLNGTGPDPYVM